MAHTCDRYVRGNRSRARGNVGEEDARLFLQTLFEVLYSLCRLMAPFTPFLVESMYQNLRVCLPVDQRMDSIHYLMVPQPDAGMISLPLTSLSSVIYIQLMH